MPIPAAFDLSGRVAVVTGAGGPDGIGFATARLLAELGAAVMISATTARIQDRVSELRIAGFDAAGIAIVDLQLHRPSLDDVFLTLTGHQAEQEKEVKPAGRWGRRSR